MRSRAILSEIILSSSACVNVFSCSSAVVDFSIPALSVLSCSSAVDLISTDISLIFNQQRLENKLTASELREYIQRYTPNKSVYTAQLDDETLLNTLKSRHIQSLSEMRSWAAYRDWEIMIL